MVATADGAARPLSNGNDVAGETADQQRGARVNDPGVLGGRFVIFAHTAEESTTCTEFAMMSPQLLMSAVSQFRPDDETSGLLRAIVESSDDAIIGKALDGTIVSWNAGAHRMYGYTPAEAVGQSIALIVPASERQGLERISSEIAQGRRVASHETVRVTRDGRLLHVSLTVSPIVDATGRVVGASAIARDITEAKRVEAALRASEERYRSIIDSAVDAIIVIDRRGRVEAFNAAAERLFGYAAKDVLGRNVNMLMPQPYHGEHDQYMARYLTTGEKRIIGIGREVTGPAQGRDDVSGPSVGRRNDDRRRAEVHGDPARFDDARRARDAAARAGRADAPR